MSYGDVAPFEKVALLRDAVSLSASASPAHDPLLLSARLLLASALDQNQQPDAAESQLKARIDSIALPASGDRTRDALNRRVHRVSSQVEMAWFLMAHQRLADAQRVAGEAPGQSHLNS